MQLRGIASSRLAQRENFHQGKLKNIYSALIVSSEIHILPALLSSINSLPPYIDEAVMIALSPFTNTQYKNIVVEQYFDSF